MIKILLNFDNLRCQNHRNLKNGWFSAKVGKGGPYRVMRSGYKPIRLQESRSRLFQLPYNNFSSHDGNRIHQNALRSCDGNFVRKTIEIEQRKHSQIECTLLRLRIR